MADSDRSREEIKRCLCIRGTWRNAQYFMRIKEGQMKVTFPLDKAMKKAFDCVHSMEELISF